jgi:hypothetical protein
LPLHGERDVLRQMAQRCRVGGRPDLERFTAAKFHPRDRGSAVQDHALVAHPLCEPAARMLRQQSREGLVQTQSGARSGHSELHRVRFDPCAIILFFVGFLHDHT